VRITPGSGLSATTMRNEWAYVDQFLEHDGHASTAPEAIVLKQRLQRAAVWEHPAHGAFSPVLASLVED